MKSSLKWGTPHRGAAKPAAADRRGAVLVTCWRWRWSGESSSRGVDARIVWGGARCRQRLISASCGGRDGCYYVACDERLRLVLSSGWSPNFATGKRSGCWFRSRRCYL